MMQRESFGFQEAVSLAVISISVKVFYTSPSIVSRFVGTASWYMTLISALTAALGFTIIFLLLKRFKGKNLVEVYEASLGRIAGSAFSLITSVFLMFVAASQLREASEVIKIYVLLMSPISFLIGISIIVVVVLSFLGLETIARVCKFVAFPLLVLLIAVFSLLSQKYEFHRMAPIFGHGLGNTLMHGIRRCSVYGEVIILAVFADSLHGINHIKKSGYVSIILSGLIISASLLSFILAFPYYTAEEVVAPIYQMVSLINYGIFFERFDPIFLFVWNISTTLAIVVLFYSSISMFARVFRIKDARPVILPAAIILFNVSMMPENLMQVVSGSTQSIRDLGWIFFYVLPLAALVVSLIRGRKAMEKNA